MIFTVSHLTRYAYARPVDLGTHLLHLQPRTLPNQRVIETQLIPTPAPSRITHGEDCFGNAITWMFVDTPHPRFAVTMQARVDVTAPAWPAPHETPNWEAVSQAAFAGGRAYQAAEFLFPSHKVPATPEASDYAKQSFTPNRPILAALLDLNDRINRDFKFRGGATTVNTPIKQVLAQRAGVCQDFSHLMIAGLRGMGLPARYVSGYIRTKPPPGQPRRIGADQSHAWVSAWLGPEHGWIDLDPTNGITIADEHVTLGWGRDYSDVSPICGVILGGGRHTVSVSVDLDALQ